MWPRFGKVARRNGASCCARGKRGSTITPPMRHRLGGHAMPLRKSFTLGGARSKLLAVVVLVVMLGLAVTTAVGWASAGGYARPELLAETEWLAQHLSDPNLRIVDMRAENAYRKGHIPGAVNVGWETLKDPDNEVYVIPPDKLTALMSKLGIGNETTVVGYDDQGGLGPTRLWWVLDYYGHTRAKVLNGGWNKWVKEKRPLTQDIPSPQPSEFAVQVDDSKICLVPELVAEMHNP